MTLSDQDIGVSIKLYKTNTTEYILDYDLSWPVNRITGVGSSLAANEPNQPLASFYLLVVADSDWLLINKTTEQWNNQCNLMMLLFLFAATTDVKTIQNSLLYQ